MGNPYSYDGFATNQQKQQAIEKDREEIISKIENGAERYLVDPITYNIIEQLARGADPIAVIDRLLTMYSEMSKALIEANMRNAQPPQYVLSDEQAKNFLKQLKK